MMFAPPRDRAVMISKRASRFSARVLWRTPAPAAARARTAFRCRSTHGSAGGGPGVFVAALESRYRSIAFCGTGIGHNEQRYAPAASRINFVPHIKGPTFLLQGRYDEDTSMVMETEPMFHLLSEPKRLQIYDGAHVPPFEVLVPALTKWFDETMGPVAQ